MLLSMRPSTCPAHQELDRFALRFQIVGRAGEQDGVPGCGGGFLDALEHGGHYNVCQSRHHDADGGGLAGTQAGCPQVRLVTEFLGNLTNPECRVGPAVGGLGLTEDPRRRRDVDPGLVGDFAQRRRTAVAAVRRIGRHLRRGSWCASVLSWFGVGRLFGD
jgi:hypothetical protein